MNDIFDTLFNTACAFPTMRSSSFTTPRVDVKENEENYELFMELPGLTEKDVDISLKNHLLIISSAEKEEKAEDDKKETKWLIRERKNLEFSRSFSLPLDSDEDNIKASFKNGILLVTVARKEKKEEKKIKITAA